jgi:hypothetical protein
MCGINPSAIPVSGASVRWVCRRGHEEEDSTPLPRLAYCTTCDYFYEWFEVTQRGQVLESECVTMPAELVR